MRFVALLLLLGGCSATRFTYMRPGYTPAGAEAVKRIAVVGWAPKGRDAAARLLANIAADRVRLKKDYIVMGAAAASRGWAGACPGPEGVLAIEVLDWAEEKGKVALTLGAELRRCADGALLWRAEAGATADPGDGSLRKLTMSYEKSAGPDALSLAAPAFVIMQDLLETMPNPALSEEELVEKMDAEP